MGYSWAMFFKKKQPALRFVFSREREEEGRNLYKAIEILTTSNEPAVVIGDVTYSLDNH